MNIQEINPIEIDNIIKSDANIIIKYFYSRWSEASNKFLEELKKIPELENSQLYKIDVEENEEYSRNNSKKSNKRNRSILCSINKNLQGKKISK